MKLRLLARYILVCLAVALLLLVHGSARADGASASEDKAKQSKLAEVLAPLIQQHRGEVAVMIKHLPSGETFKHRADVAMPTASLIKFPLLMAAYKAIDEGQLALDQKIKLTKDDQVPGSGVLTTHFSPGLELSLRDAMHLMIVYSDNTATNLVIDQVGLESTNQLMDALGCDDTRLHSKVYRRDTSIAPERSQKYGLGSTSCEDMIRLLALLSEHQFLSKERSEQILTHLYACEANSTVPRHLPTGTRVAHKTGAVNETRTDAGLIDSPAGPIAFCVLTTANEDRGWSDSNEAELLAAEIGLAAYKHFVGDTEPATPVVARTLKLGAAGDLVEALQRTLNARTKPSPGISVDGDFGPNTESAVMAFQEQSGLDPTGVVDRETWKKLGPLETEDAPAPAPEEVATLNTKREPREALDGPPVVTCKAWCFVDAASGRQLAGENAEVVRDPASVTKIMTAYLVLKLSQEKPEVLEQQITFSQRADDTSGSSANLKAGEQLPVRQLLFGLMLPSGNDASVALAEHFGEQLLPDRQGSSYDRFIEAMNLEAKKLGMTNTGYKNPHGLTAKGHVTTTADMAKLARAALDIPLFREIVNTRQKVATVSSLAGYERQVVWNNTNRLLSQEGYTGVKTGTTGPAGACLVACGERDGHETIGVVLGSSSTDARYADMRNLFRYVWGEKLHVAPSEPAAQAAAVALPR